ncbi:hypothetical protein KSF_040830 [Reticulibacter mediterranei]|uniref:Uncharacterized protein n=1 Tax=Reticulibacter mediterranei TaxID=2778369 RepID=A0A8J3INK9_9CHLR|nr:hypothetical protein [Reticulibacter mediterranei]GHO94035.1 hypothetical protein KSF_040830 [Reticulibacter mediterranei]
MHAWNIHTTAINFYAGGKKLHVSFEKFQENLCGIIPGARYVDTRFFLGKMMVSAAGTQHYLYIVPDGGLYIYNMDNGFTQLKYVSLPTITDARRSGWRSALYH